MVWKLGKLHGEQMFIAETLGDEWHELVADLSDWVSHGWFLVCALSEGVTGLELSSKSSEFSQHRVSGEAQ